jgi:hypothetical protein
MNGSGAREVHILRSSLPSDRTYVHRDGDGQPVPYHVLNEVEVSGQHYVVMQKHDDHPDDAYLYRVHQGMIEEIEDEVEWENIAEAVDELLYFHDFK